MKIHLHGDSWCYLWPRSYAGTYSDLQEESKLYDKLLARHTPDVIAFSPLGNKDSSAWGHSLSESHAIDFYDQMFVKVLGHELINAGVPGLDLETIANWIQMDEFQSDADIHIVMAPFLFRSADSLAKIPAEIFQSSEVLCDYVAEQQKFYIQQICDHAKKTKTHYIIIGAHGPLSGKCDEALNEYSHIMYYDWLKEFIWEVTPNYEQEKERLKENPQYFRFATTINYKKVHLESWGEDVIGMVSDDLASGRKGSYMEKLIFPDNGHPNAMVMLDMVSKITKFAKDLGIN